jgi:hypothetical protein
LAAFAKALVPMLCREAGKVSVLRPLFAKAFLSMLVRVGGNVTDVRALVFPKAPLLEKEPPLMVVRPVQADISTEVMPLP